MSTFSQSIPNLLLGISQQPDSRKRPGQVKDALNAYPDFALGMLKRPGGRFVAKLHNAPTGNPEAKWFQILKGTEKYIGCFKDGIFQAWNLVNGKVALVNMGTNAGVSGSCSYTNLGTTLANFNKDITDFGVSIAGGTLVGDVNTSPVTSAGTTIEGTNPAGASLDIVTANQSPTVASTIEFTYTYTSGNVIENIKTGILRNASSLYTLYENGSVVTNGTLVASSNLPTGYAIGTERTDAHPLLASEGYRIYELQKTTAAVGGNLSQEQTDYNAAKAIKVQAYVDINESGSGTKDLYDAQWSNCSSATTTSSMYLHGATPDDIEVFNLNDYTFVLNKAKEVKMLTGASDLAHPNLDTHRAQATIVTVQSGKKYEVTIDIDVSGVAGYPNRIPVTAGANDTAADVAENLADAINKRGIITPQQMFTNSVADGTYKNVAVTTISGTPDNGATVDYVISGGFLTKMVFSNQGDIIGGQGGEYGVSGLTSFKFTVGSSLYGFSATPVGPSVYITYANSFGFDTANNLSEDSMVGITDTASNVTTLPLHSKDGYVVKIVNSQDFDLDDMYVKFVTDDGATYGMGQWEETQEPGLKYKFDLNTMPHVLVEQNGAFTFETFDWSNRLVGDDNTNPLPEFVDNKISHIFFYRNRIGFLSEGNVNMTKAGDINDWSATSALAATDDDPISIGAAGTTQGVLEYVVPTSVGLVIYGGSEQFLLSTDSDILAPKTAKINALSNYEADSNIEAVSLGTTQAFVSKTPLYTRLFELADISQDQPPVMQDVSDLVPELIPSTVDSMAASPALSIVSLGEIGKSELYQFRFYQRGKERRLVNAWYRWNLTGTLVHQFFDANTYYCLVRNGTEVYIQTFDMNQSAEQGFLTLPTGEKTDPCLDYFVVNPDRDFISPDTRVYLPFTPVAGKELALLLLSGTIGSTPSNTSDDGGTVYTGTQLTTGVTDGRHWVEIEGDFRGRNMVLGYLYDMEITLPTLYRYTVKDRDVVNDDVSSLIIHRLKAKTGLSGPVDYKISITGIADWTNTVTVTAAGQYQLNNVNMQASATHVVPIHQRNENLAIQIIGNTPFPVSLLGLDWEGKLNQRFYRRG